MLYFNTSYVVIKLKSGQKRVLLEFNFNTSYVVIKLNRKILFFPAVHISIHLMLLLNVHKEDTEHVTSAYFNTSYVVIKLILILKSLRIR